jgi:hypothetical protein
MRLICDSRIIWIVMKSKLPDETLEKGRNPDRGLLHSPLLKGNLSLWIILVFFRESFYSILHRLSIVCVIS